MPADRSDAACTVAGVRKPQHHRKSVDFSITSSVHSSLPKHLGSISKRPARFSSSHNMHRSHFWVPVFGLTGKSKRNLINALK
jgi:hypothetical protein